MASRGDQEGVAKTLSQGANVNASNLHGSTPLMHAASCGHVEVVRILLAAGADLNASVRLSHRPLLPSTTVWSQSRDSHDRALSLFVSDALGSTVHRSS